MIEMKIEIIIFQVEKLLDINFFMMTFIKYFICKINLISYL